MIKGNHTHTTHTNFMCVCSKIKMLCFCAMTLGQNIPKFIKVVCIAIILEILSE